MSSLEKEMVTTPRSLGASGVLYRNLRICRVQQDQHQKTIGFHEMEIMPASVGSIFSVIVFIIKLSQQFVAIQ